MSDTPIYDELMERYINVDPIEHEDEEIAQTAGEQDHSNPWFYAGEEADPPEDTGKSPDYGEVY